MHPERKGEAPGPRDMEKKSNDQKIKLLKLMEILMQETDAAHPIRTSDFCERLAQMNITCDPRTLGRDMRFLNEHGYEILSVQSGHEKAYYIEDRSFQLPELQILIDAVQAASFITEKKTAELTDKIAALAGTNRAEVMKRSLVRFNTNKHTNESVFYTVDALTEAILQRKKVSFRYFDLDERALRVYRRDGGRYTAEPLSLVFNEDNYYLLCYSAKYDDMYNFRVDRMSDVRTEEEDLSPKAVKRLEKLDAAAYTEQAFKMFHGESRAVTLRFGKQLTGVVFDKFGEDTKMRPLGDGSIEALVLVQVSPTFYGWLCQFGGGMEIERPESVKKAFRDYMDDMMRKLS